jgi:DNA processing protein
LFTSGKIDLKNRKIISIVGTPSYGTEFCRKLEDLAADPIIVSGFAYGVDIVAHQLAMEQQNNRRRSSWFKPNLSQNIKKNRYKVEQNGGFMTELEYI